jgi:hypothetical protein
MGARFMFSDIVALPERNSRNFPVEEETSRSAQADSELNCKCNPLEIDFQVHGECGGPNV